MQRIVIAGLLFFVASCKSSDHPSDEKNKPEQWMLDTKVRYDYKVDNQGRIDTTFIYTQKFKNGAVTDSATMFVVSRYNGNIYDEIVYRFDSAHKPVETMFTRNISDNSGRQLARRITVGGKLLSNEEYRYNDSNLLAKAIKVQATAYNQIMNSQAEAAATSMSSIVYDTLTANYEYDAGKKVIVTKFINGRGNLVSTDINVYSGNQPLLTTNVTTKGDTVKRIKYEQNRGAMTTVTETDSLIQAQSFLGGVEVAKRTKYKNRNEQWRSATKYDEKGRRVEEDLYKLMQ